MTQPNPQQAHAAAPSAQTASMGSTFAGSLSAMRATAFSLLADRAWSA